MGLYAHDIENQGLSTEQSMLQRKARKMLLLCSHKFIQEYCCTRILPVATLQLQQLSIHTTYQEQYTLSLVEGTVVALKYFLLKVFTWKSIL